MWRLLVLLVACGDGAQPAIDAAPDPARVLVFTRTLGYRHADAIDAGSLSLPTLLAEHGVTAEVTEDPIAFTPENLARFRAVFFMYTSGNDILDAGGKAALEAFVRGGGGWLGIHSAADTEYAWPFYAELMIAQFRTHPPIQLAAITIEAPEHPAVQGSPSPWQATDEWYDFTANPRAVGGVQVLATIDEATYQGGSTGADHPMIWAHERLGGRVLYSELGHVAARWQEPAFVGHVTAAVLWVMRLR